MSIPSVGGQPPRTSMASSMTNAVRGYTTTCFFYWVNDISMEVVDEIFPDEDSNLDILEILSIPRDALLFTDIDLDAESILECCIRSVLTRAKTPRFKAIAPGLEVPHDTVAFTSR
ncbi:hypothetical protein PENSOL_c023G00086 [Penicillium solitum]|uniref:Uncharacterized protein n=1 Tax=Penicillium solitum TaxID=60172 RepID=A0A1V6R044_9EURO|nr:uncharacterized protein PENSOL_c023G00086 [Penicillium solitum]OQD94834.1 hypothetical protein PENSOL_c023G00086 [Penicillium solitum]